MIRETKRKAFNFLRSYFDVLNELKTDKDKLEFLLAIVNKQFLNEEPKDLSFLVNLCYQSQRHQIESSVKGWERATNDTLLTTPPTTLGTTPPTTPKEEEEEEKEKEKEKEKEEYISVNTFLLWFNKKMELKKGVKGKFKVLTSTDENNLKKLLKGYNLEDFNFAVINLFNSEWANENKMVTPSHFLRVENFNKYLNQEHKKEKVIIHPKDYLQR